MYCLEVCYTWLSSLEYVKTFTPVVDGSDGICSSMPPTTYEINNHGVRKDKRIHRILSSLAGYIED